MHSQKSLATHDDSSERRHLNYLGNFTLTLLPNHFISYQLSGANCECDGQVWRMDVGMSYGVLNRPVQVLEIAKDADSGAEIVRVLSDSPMTATIDEEAEVMI